ncbi:ABC transporter ATP-binding protein [Vibrio hangzhouensis]|uniref:Putative ABC transport system ATP-binding protein n=1 Tax=Vibrio hangzhouensis TaxID=462991 RepID=A0A1H5TM46_9VIBR|nr:ATP-binding cassette domain-containing protein [Vibrio hangzhouensis]SEF63839.1 putative ABC transport system ATP-binding protein [Vibrio hangzhouensis]
MIEIQALEFSYPDCDFQLSINNLEVKEQEKVAIIGPSGSGKTTLLNLMSGIVLANNGSINFGNVDIQKLSESQRRQLRISKIGFIFQDFELIDYLTIEDNILHLYRINNVIKLTKDVKARARDLAEKMGISRKLKYYPAQLSQGEKQRAAICRALLTSPSLILADEATGNLDPTNKKLILKLLFENVISRTATLVAVTHDYELLPFFDRVIDFQELIEK